MYQINKITSSPVVDFAAEELKKYLRMMMPRCGEIPIAYDPDASDGFRLGLMADFGLSSAEAKDPALDDIVHIDTDERGGIIAGSNLRSVLQAVYRYLRENGCRWLFPGIDGEYIPIRQIAPTKYHKMADCRFRGQCNEGSEAQYNMIETIDFSPKIGLNVYMLEFDIPYGYYQGWYDHLLNDTYKKETVTPENVLQWKRMCEVEMSKRGLQFHDRGHGWTMEAFGFDAGGTWAQQGNGEDLTNVGNGRFVAMINGKRAFFNGRPMDTNFCMSNAEARQIFANCVADYAQCQSNVDYLHIWLADSKNNHCECSECVKKDTADWYVMLLNDIDAELERRGLENHLVFIVYSDLLWAPREEKIRNPKRFSMLFAPITRVYNESYDVEPDMASYTGYHRNDHILPRGMGENLACLEKWKESYPGDVMSYDYHFHWVHCVDPGYMSIAKRVHEDIRNLKKAGVQGLIEDQTQRNYFPTGFPMYVYGNTLFDNSLTLEQLEEDYFSHAFGEDWQQVRDYMWTISNLFDFNYMICYPVFGVCLGSTVSEEMVEKLGKVAALVDDFRPVIEKNLIQPMRAATVSWQLLDEHSEFTKFMARIFRLRAEDNDEGALEEYERMRTFMAPKEPRLQRYFDHGLFFECIKLILTKAYKPR